jgi:hypothetical protein
MDLWRILDQVVASETDHARRLVKSAAVISEALRLEGLEATVVGGSAIEVHAPDAYTTSDIDLVIPERYGVDWNAAQERAFRLLGFERRHRHWVRDDLFVEIPSRTLSDPVVTLRVGPFGLRVIAKEVVLADRIVGFKHWGVTDYGLQAIAMLAALGPELDEEALHRYLERESARDAYEVLRRLAQGAEPITHERLGAELDRLRNPGGTR